MGSTPVGGSENSFSQYFRLENASESPFLVQSALLEWLWGLPAAKALRRYGAKALRL